MKHILNILIQFLLIFVQWNYGDVSRTSGRRIFLQLQSKEKIFKRSDAGIEKIIVTSTKSALCVKTISTRTVLPTLKNVSRLKKTSLLVLFYNNLHNCGPETIETIFCVPFYRLFNFERFFISLQTVFIVVRVYSIVRGRWKRIKIEKT